MFWLDMNRLCTICLKHIIVMQLQDNLKTPKPSEIVKIPRHITHDALKQQIRRKKIG